MADFVAVMTGLFDKVCSLVRSLCEDDVEMLTELDRVRADVFEPVTDILLDTLSEFRNVTVCECDMLSVTVSCMDRECVGVNLERERVTSALSDFDAEICMLNEPPLVLKD